MSLNMLDDLMNRQSKELDRAASAPLHKRPRIEIRPLFQEIAKSLHDMRTEINTKSIKLNPDLIEIEMRIGMLITDHRRWKSYHKTGGGIVVTSTDRGVSFKSGIDEINADKIKNILKSSGYSMNIQEPQRVRVDESGNNRCVFDSQGREVGLLEAKDKFLRRDIACLGHQFDMRIDVASEISVGGSNGQQAHQSGVPRDIVWHVERLKRRTKFRLDSNPNSAWVIDMTEVETTTLQGVGAGKKTVSIELEFEMLPVALKSWLSADDSKAVEVTSRLATELLSIFNLCIPSSISTGDDVLSITSLPQSPSVVNALASITNKIRGQNGSLDFIGSMPLNISRRNLLTLQQNSYFVTEKSDGVRYLMYSLPKDTLQLQSDVDSTSSCGAVLMNRSKHLFLPPGWGKIGEALGLGTVLDGEVVHNLKTKKSVFLVFDILAMDGRPCASMPFDRRLEIIRTSIAPRLKRLNDSGTSHLRIVEKIFWPKADLRKLLQRMVVENGERVYRESVDRHHKSDGLIFQPNLPYVFSTDINLVKWKWPELASVDLTVNCDGNGKDGPALFALGPDGVLVDCTMRGKSRVGLGEFDTLRVNADTEDSRQAINVAEVAYNPTYGLWSYFHLREDKDQPNYINTVLSILMEQAEAISIEELEYRLLARSEAENDFSQQLSKMKQKLLEFQRTRTAPAVERR